MCVCVCVCVCVWIAVHTIIVRTARKMAWDMGSRNCSVPRSCVRATAPSTWLPHAVIVSSVDMMVYVACMSPRPRSQPCRRKGERERMGWNLLHKART